MRTTRFIRKITSLNTNLTGIRNLSLIGAITGNAKTDNSNNMTIDTSRKGCIVGGSSSESNLESYPWYKFASISIPKSQAMSYLDEHIVFMVNMNYGNNKGKGILSAGIRTSTYTNENFLNSKYLRWLVCGDQFKSSNFVMMYNEDSDTLEIELWVKLDILYASYEFTVLTEGSRNIRASVWTMYDNYSGAGSASPTEGYTMIESDIIELNNRHNTQYSSLNVGSLTNLVKYVNSVGLNKSYVSAIGEYLFAELNGGFTAPATVVCKKISEEKIDYLAFGVSESIADDMRVYIGSIELPDNTVTFKRLLTDDSLQWKLIDTYILNDTMKEINGILIPSDAREILIFAGYKNPESGTPQIYGGRSYTIPRFESGRNVVYENEMYVGNNTRITANKFIAIWHATTGDVDMSIESGELMVRIHYR